MTTKLTRRDKVLLYIMLIALVIFAFIWLLILPQMNLSSELDLSIAEAEALQMPMEAAVKGLEGISGVASQAQQDLDRALADFPEKMANYEIDKTLTGIMIDGFGLQVDSLTMSPVPAGIQLPVYGNAEAGGEASAQSEGEAAPETIPLLTSSVSITAAGSRANLQRFVDDLFQNRPEIRVTGYSFSGEDQVNLSLTLDYYMKSGPAGEIQAGGEGK